ncbi:hypothetical protein FACS189447_06010 [Spirochaetia bacterium]|nr:hypothetical protein FACS189447_06010 [Spirochaetia bacterium]
MTNRLTASDKIFHYCCTAFLALSCILVLYPLVYCISCSFSSTSAITQAKVWLWPVEFNFKAYRSVFEFVQ